MRWTAVFFLFAALCGAQDPGQCTWQGGDCDGQYDCNGCGVNCACADGGEWTRPCGGLWGPCDSGPGPTCTKAGPGKCDACSDGLNHSEYGCTECFSDEDCAKYKPGAKHGGHYRQFCNDRAGRCDGECGTGLADCKQKYKGAKNLCIDADGTGGWCYECDAMNQFEHDYNVCDAVNKNDTLAHSSKPFCLADTLACVSCTDLYKTTGKCPNDGRQYSLTCVLDEASSTCFARDDAPCRAFTPLAWCPSLDHDKNRPGGACETKWDPDKECVDKKHPMATSV